MNFHVASRGVTFILGFLAGGPALNYMLNCSNKTSFFFLARFARSFFFFNLILFN